MSGLVTERKTVTADECWTMVRSKVCTAGTLVGDRGVYQTLNHLEVDYDVCSRPMTFTVDQCSAIETAVYEQYGQEDMQSSAGDASHCRYEQRSCQLADHTLLVWDVAVETECKYLPTEKVGGSIVDRHLITDTLDLALTFTHHGHDNKPLCDGKMAH